MKIRVLLLALLSLCGVAAVEAQGVVCPAGAIGCGGGGGSSTLTAGTTATSGCTDGGFLYSLTSLIRCGANAINDGSVITLGGVAGSGENVVVTNGTSTRSIFIAKDNTTAVFTVADGGAITATGAMNLNGGITTGGGNVSLNNTTTMGNGVGFNLSTAGSFIGNIDVTPTLAHMRTATSSNLWNLIEVADTTFNFGTGACGGSACTDPGFSIRSSVQDTTQYNHNAVWGTAGGAIKALTGGAATSVIRIPVASGAGTGGVLNYTIFASDATDHQTREGEIKFAIVNKAGTETCTISAASEAADGSVIAASLGTLTYGITCDTTPANAVDIQFNAVSSLTETTLNAYYRVRLVGPGQPARQ